MRRESESRPYSDKYVPGMSEFDLFMNKNTDWTAGRFVQLFYLVFVVLCWALITLSGFFTFADSWTVINIVHGAITFVIFHWIKGCPDDSTQGEYNGLTLFEQIDAGTPWTNMKKFLMIVPTLLTYIACQTADYKPFYVVVNCSIFIISIIAKIPEMYRVRIFGINSTLGIDVPVVKEKDN